MYIQSDYIDDGESRTEQELWIAFCKNNRKAFSVLFLRFYEQLFRYGMNFSDCEETVKDGIQKLFFRLWKKRKNLDLPSSVDGYLYVSLRRILLRNSNGETAREQRANEFVEYSSEPVTSIEEMIIVREKKKEQQNQFQRSLHVLTPRQKEALLLRVDSGMSNGEIAGIMSLSDKRVRNLIYEATKRLREEIYKMSD